MRNDKTTSDNEADNPSASRLRPSRNPHRPPTSAGVDNAEDVETTVMAPSAPAIQSDKPVAWRDLPRKGQLCIITLARISEPLVQTSLQAYLYYQLKSFDPSLPDSTIASQAGILHASFMFSQFIVALMWGTLADSPRVGRKVVLLIGLLGSCASCLAFGFSTSFGQALVFRMLGGITNGNIGVMRTMISEIIREKKFQSRAFLLLPMTFNIGVIIGPILGGVLSDPAASYPGVFGKVDLFVRFPYALPNIVSAVFLLTAAIGVWLGLEETHDALRDLSPDLGIRVRKKFVSLIRRYRQRSRNGSYAEIPTEDVELTSESPVAKSGSKKRYTQKLPFRRIFTRNVTLTLFAYSFLTFHVGTCNALWFVFLSTPVWDPKESKHGIHLPFQFTGGLGLQPRETGMAMAILGVIGIAMQLFLYPTVSTRLGTIKSWRLSLLCFPLSYFLMPYLSIIPSTSAPPSAKTGVLVWLGIIFVLFIQVTGRTFALPAQVVLVNNSVPHPSVLGTVHGIGQSVSSAARTIGPSIGGMVYGFGLNHGVVGLAWWALSGIAVSGFMASLLVREGNGHEIWLEGDEED